MIILYIYNIYIYTHEFHPHPNRMRGQEIDSRIHSQSSHFQAMFKKLPQHLVDQFRVIQAPLGGGGLLDLIAILISFITFQRFFKSQEFWVYCDQWGFIRAFLMMNPWEKSTYELQSQMSLSWLIDHDSSLSTIYKVITSWSDLSFVAIVYHKRTNVLP